MINHVKNHMISAIVPAYNEEKNIEYVLRALTQSSRISEVIVVDDGSLDQTAAVAAQEGARVITQKNQGKAGAMATGAHAARGEFLFFVDADLRGFQEEHIEALIRPVRERGTGMSVGLRDRGAHLWWFLERVLPVIGGERVMRRDHFLSLVSHNTARRYGIEIVMNTYCAKHHIPVILVRMPGVTPVINEEKYGLLRGLSRRIRMITHVIHAMVSAPFERTL